MATQRCRSPPKQEPPPSNLLSRGARGAPSTCRNHRASLQGSRGSLVMPLAWLQMALDGDESVRRFTQWDRQRARFVVEVAPQTDDGKKSSTRSLAVQPCNLEPITIFGEALR